jgi:hypothetical protein
MIIAPKRHAEGIFFEDVADENLRFVEWVVSGWW